MTSKGSIGGALFLIFIGLLIASAGGLFTWLMWRSFSRASGQNDWPERPALVLQSELRERQVIEHSPPEYSFRILYGYDYQGKAYEGDRLTLRENPWSKKREKAEDVLEAYPEGSSTTCLVNPDNPSQAILKADTKAPGYSIWFPVIFVIGGAGVVVTGLKTLFTGRLRRQD